MATRADHSTATGRRVRLGPGSARLPGRLRLPSRCTGLVVLALQQVGDRRQAALRVLASALSARGLGTLTLAPPAVPAAPTGETALRAPLDNLTEGLTEALDWLACRRPALPWTVGLLGAGPEAAAALAVAAARPQQVAAVVSLSGQTDLARDSLERVEAATLLVVGAADGQLEGLNRDAWRRLPGARRLETLPAEHRLVDEPVAWAGACALGAAWLEGHLRRRGGV